MFKVVENIKNGEKIKRGNRFVGKGTPPLIPRCRYCIQNNLKQIVARIFEKINKSEKIKI